MYKHVIWDFDGTLFDTYTVMAKTFQEKLNEMGYNETVDEIKSYMQVTMTYAIEHYKEKYNIDDEFLKDYNIKRKEEEKRYCKPFECIEYVCKAIFDNEFNNYLYTHRGMSSIDLLKKFDLYKYFRDFITFESGFKRKPDPEALNFLIKKYNMNLNEAIMIGDRDLDILAAKNAGIDSHLFTEKTNFKALFNFL